jgi:catechol 2,3-dioxygenase-like lactoylglutathione lyase family enzyme
MTTQVSTQFMTGHVGLNVRDLARSKRFYQDVFGFDLSVESNEEGRAFAFLTQNNAIVLTLWQQSDGSFAADKAGLHHLFVPGRFHRRGEKGGAAASAAWRGDPLRRCNRACRGSRVRRCLLRRSRRDSP